MSLLGLDIGKITDPPQPSVKGIKPGTLQKMLIDRGYDLGAYGPNGDGVDSSAGNTTRKALHNWKIDVGITVDTSAGSGVIGIYEYAALHPEENVGGGDHPDGDHGELASKSSVSKVASNLASHTADAKTNTPHS